MDVLLGIGGTDDSFDALSQVAERTAETGDDLTVAVLENPESPVDPETVENRVRERLADAGLSLAEEGGGVSLRHLAGEPGPALVELAEREDFDQIVLGGGERSPMGKIALGEVAEFVLVNARTTVTLVR